MRIIGGKHRGRIIRAPKGLPVRPTTDQAREGLFNILMHRFDLEDARVLDAFAGTGAVSYEFLSRGAAELTAVDQNAGCVRFIQSMFRELGAGGIAKARRQATMKFLKSCDRTFDLIFMDPPYVLPDMPALVQAVFDHGLLAPEGWMILEHATRDNFSDLPYFFELRKYGSSSFTFFQHIAQ
ncbi:MAG: 16S rRNA (guanine(966)-N(2))-methyltransferase RsmD [Bacteroidota bacterium]